MQPVNSLGVHSSLAPRKSRSFQKMFPGATWLCMWEKNARGLSLKSPFLGIHYSKHCLIKLGRSMNSRPTRNSAYLAMRTSSSTFFMMSVHSRTKGSGCVAKGLISSHFLSSPYKDPQRKYKNGPQIKYCIPTWPR